MKFLKNLLVIVIFFYSVFGISQSRSFSSNNIDSLLTAYQSKTTIGLPKAYCLDQIVRFYTSNKNFELADKFILQYGKISNSLKNKDVTNRYLYRSSYLHFLKSDKKELDTINFTKAYKYFEKKDPKFIPFMANQMVSYLRGTDGFGAKWLKDKEQLITWYLKAGEANYKYGYYSDAERVFFNAGLNISYKNPKRQSAALRRSIDANRKAKNKVPFNTYMKLTEVYLNAKNSEDYIDAVLELEKEIISLKQENLIKQFKSELEFNNFYEKVEKRKKRIILEKEIEKNFALVNKRKKVLEERFGTINLPQGVYKYDYYDSKSNKERYILTIDQSIITKKIISKYDNSTITYKVQVDYPISESKKLLIVKNLSTTYVNGLDLILLENRNNKLIINEGDISSNSPESQLELINHLIDKNEEIVLQNNIRKSTKSYFTQKKYDSLINLPKIKENEVEDFKLELKEILNKNETSDQFWFADLISREMRKSKGIVVRNLLIKKGYQPFSSIPELYKYEHDNNPKPVDKITKAFDFILFLNNYVYPFLKYLVLFLLLRFIYLKAKKEPKNEVENVKTKKPKPANIIFGTLGCTIAGAILGFFGTWEVTQLMGSFSKGGEIAAAMFAIIGLVIGMLIGFIIGLLITARKK